MFRPSMTLAGCLQPSSGFLLVSFWLKLTIADLEPLKTVSLGDAEDLEGDDDIDSSWVDAVPAAKGRKHCYQC